MNRMKLFLVFGVVLGLAFAPAMAEIEDTVQRSFEVGPGGLLSLRTDMGSIEVASGGSGRLDVEVIMKARTDDASRFQEMVDRLRMDFQQQGNDVDIVVENEERNRWRDRNSWREGLRLHFRVTVPTTYNVDLKTAGGSIGVEDLDGDVKAMTSGGSLSFGRITGTVDGKTSGGSISLDETGGPVDVKTSGGSINIGNARGDVVAHTSGGSINVEEVYGSIDAKTSGGSVTARITSQPQADCRLVTSGGSVTVELASGISLDLDASTSSGRVISDFEVAGSGGGSQRGRGYRTARSWDDERKQRQLKGPLGGGGPGLYLRTSGGNIRIKEMGM